MNTITATITSNLTGTITINANTLQQLAAGGQSSGTAVQNPAANFNLQAGFRRCLKGILLSVQWDRHAPA